MRLLVVLAVLAVVGTVANAAPATRPTAEAAARAAKLAANAKSFQLQLSYHGEQDKPFYELFLSVKPVDAAGANPFSPAITITPAQAETIIAHLANDGFFDRAIDISNKRLRPPANPCYTMQVRYDDGNERPELFDSLGWGLPLLARLDSLRGILDWDAAKAMDLLLGRLSGHRTEWEKKQRQQAIVPLATPPRVPAPPASAFIRALGDPSNDVRATAAEALRAAVAADPASVPNHHDRAYWQKRLAAVVVGTSVDDALKFLLPDATPEKRKAASQAGAWSGQSGFSVVRLDDYWTATLQLVDAGREKIAQVPTLNPSVRSVWVQPPEKFNGLWVTWFVNGQNAHEMQYRDGVYDGTFTAFHDDGSKSYEQHYRNGVCDGADTGWYPSGRKGTTPITRTANRKDGGSTGIRAATSKRCKSTRAAC